MNKKLYRDEFHQKIGGVCAGLSEYFETDVTLIRVLFVIAAFMSVGVVAYIILWIVLPKKGYPFNNFGGPTVDYRVPPQQPYADQAGAAPQANPFGTPNRPNPFAGPQFNPGMPPQRSHAGIIIGVVLILIGAFILIDNYDLFPNFDFGDLWPVILVVVGGGLIVSGQTKQVWQKSDWNNGDKTDNSANTTLHPADDAATTEQ